jgi:N6-L-threonylcarbamoyladenine synthase
MILGIDTSCYTTSLAVVDGEGNLIWQRRRLLDVPAGERGLAQSAALFKHTQQLPQLVAELAEAIDTSQIKAVCASTRPRPVTGSYMPVFTISDGAGQMIAAAMQKPYYPVSHQEGHIMAGLWSALWRPQGNFWQCIFPGARRSCCWWRG